MHILDQALMIVFRGRGPEAGVRAQGAGGSCGGNARLSCCSSPAITFHQQIYLDSGRPRHHVTVLTSCDTALEIEII